MSAWTAPHSAPMFWWWPEPGGMTRVIMLDAYVLVVSDPLVKDDVRAIETARRTGELLDVSFGDTALVVPLEQVARIEYVPSLRRVVFVLADERTLCRVEAPAGHEGVVSGLFEVTRGRLAPGADVRRIDQERVRRTRERSTSDLRLMAALGAFGLLTLALAINARQSVVEPTIGGDLTARVNDVFLRVGYVPAAIALVGIVALQILRVRNGRPTFDVVVKGPPTWAVSVPHPYLREVPAPAPAATSPEGLAASPLLHGTADGFRRAPLGDMMLAVAPDPADQLSANPAHGPTTF